MKKTLSIRSVLILVIGLASPRAFSQQMQGQPINVVPATPNAMKMTEYIAQRPNMYTGTASVSIPLYTIDFDGMSLPLSLSYNASGVRTNEEASEVGLGWAINNTGVISRNIQGGDDLFPGSPSYGHKGYCYNDRAIRYKPDFGYDWTPPNQSVPADSTYYEQLAQGGFDTQPDIFNYNFFGHSGSFVLTQKVKTGTIQVVKITQDACSIIFYESGKSFSVITPEGYKGDFNIKEKSTTFSATVTSVDRMQCCSVANIDITGMVNNSGRFRTVTSWYLSKITSPRGRIVTFSYDVNAADSSSNYLSNSRSFSELPDITLTPYCMQVVQEHIYLTTILSDEVRVDFTMEDREDLKINDIYPSSTYFPQTPRYLRRYNGLTVTGLGLYSTLHKTISLVQGYFNEQYHDQYSDNNNDTEYQWLRGRLDRVTIDDQEYRFTYDYGSMGIPNKLTNGIDHFGFYNGQDMVTQLVPVTPYPVGAFLGTGYVATDLNTPQQYMQRAERVVQLSMGKAGLLTKVKYPTRGYTVFEYESHTYLPATSGYFTEHNFQSAEGGNYAGGTRIKSIKQYDYDDRLLLYKSYQYTQAGVTTGQLMTPLYNRYARQIYDGTGRFNFQYQSYSTIPGNSSAEGKIIGYSRVQETVNGSGTDNYTNTYTFENTPNQVLSFNAVAVGFPNLNGQAIEVKNFDNTGKQLQRTLNQNYYHTLPDSIESIAYQQAPGASKWFNYIVFTSLKRTFISPYIVTTSVNDQVLSDSLVTEKKFTFNGSYLMASEQTKNSTGDSIITLYKRPSDYSSPGVTITHMTSPTVNMVSPVIEEIIIRNGSDTLSAVGNQYQYDAPHNQVNQFAAYSFNRNLGGFKGSITGETFPATSYELKTLFSAYDTELGKLREYTSNDGVTHAFIWGYNKKLPIAHGVGITYNSLSSAYLADSTNYETTLRNHPNLVGKQVTTYSHIPLVGVKRITDPTGLKKSFEYDTYGRLQTTHDTKGFVLTKNQYHFMSQPLQRVISATTSIDFGTFYNCNLPITRTLTITNSGDDDLKITSLGMPSNFSSSWPGGTISAGTSMYVTITFTGTIQNTYAGTITIYTSNATNLSSVPGSVTTSVTGNYINGGVRAISISPNPQSFPTAHVAQYITVTAPASNTDCLTITGLSYPDPQSCWTATLPTTPIILTPGQSTTIAVTRYLDTVTSWPITVLCNSTSGNTVLTVTKN